MSRNFRYLLNPEVDTHTLLGDPIFDTEVYQEWSKLYRQPRSPIWCFSINKTHSDSIGITATVYGGPFTTRQAALKEAQRVVLALFGHCRVVKCKDYIRKKFALDSYRAMRV